VSLLLRAVAIGWSVVLLVRARDRWIVCFTAMLTMLTARLAGALLWGDGTWMIAGPAGLGEVGALVVSLLMVGSIAFLDRTLSARDRSERALRESRASLEARVAERTAELQQSEAKFRQLADHVDAVFWLADLENNRPLYVSPGYEKLWGRSWDELAGTTAGWLDAVHPGDRANVERAYRDSFAGANFDMEFRILLPDGTVRWIRNRGFAIHDGGPTPHRMAGLASDITEAKQIEEALRESNEELEVFAQTISHDLKAPLRAIEAFAATVREECAQTLDDRGREYLDLIAQGSARVHAQLNDLLQHARLGRTVGHERVELSEVVRRVMDDLNGAVESRRATVEVEGELPAVVGHRGLLETMVQNLLTNALKFVPADRRPHVTIGAVRGAGSCRVYVRDNGIGIAPEYHERIFGIFERLHAREKFPGTGIGLAIVKKAARLHGGDVTVESTPGAGSTFWLTLSCCPRADDDDAAGDQTAASSRSGAHDVAQGNCTSSKVSGGRVGRKIELTRSGSAA